MRISIFGGTGYAGGRIAREAAARGHEVVSFTREAPGGATSDAGVRYEVGNLLDAADRARALDADVVVVAVAPRGDMLDRYRGGVSALAADARAAGTRVGVIGGAGSLLVSDGGPRLVDTPQFQPEEAKPESLAAAGALDDLRAEPEGLDWFMVSPAVVFGSFAPGERRGTYRVGGDVIVADADGLSAIGGDDFATALVDELESGAHRRTRFTVAY